MRCFAQWHSAGAYHLFNGSRVLLAQYISHTLVVVDSCARMQLQHLVGKRRIRHHIPSDIPRDNIRVHGLHIALTRLVIDGVIGERILCDSGTQTCHKAGELFLVEARIHHKDVVSISGLQSQVSDGLVERIRVVAYWFHLRDARLLRRTAVDDTGKLLALETVAEIHVWREVPLII